MPDKNFSYVAGVVDGEGCISICRNNNRTGGSAYSLQISVANTSLDLVRWIVKHFGGKYFTIDKTQRNPNYKVQYHWHVSGNKNRETFLLGILPYLIVKREQALLALEYLRTQRFDHEVVSGDIIHKRESLLLQCQFLNSGKSVTTNMFSSARAEKRESELYSNVESVPVVTQGANQALNSQTKLN